MSVKFTDNSAEILTAFDLAMRNGLEAIGMKAETYAKKELYPGHGFDTGRLKNSITHARWGTSEYIGTNVEYAIYVENGSRTNKALHFLRKAATEHGEEYKRLMEESMKNA